MTRLSWARSARQAAVRPKALSSFSICWTFHSTSSGAASPTFWILECINRWRSAVVARTTNVAASASS